MECAFENLMQQGYNSFLLTIGCNTVSVYTTDGLLKVFDSHARNSSGMVDRSGTCVLLEVNSIINLVEYFKTSHRTDVLYELKGVQINVQQPMQIINMSACMHSNCVARPAIDSSQQTCSTSSAPTSPTTCDSTRSEKMLCNMPLCTLFHNHKM